MPKLLKLSALQTYSAPFTKGETVKKGEIIRVTDDIAAKLLKGSRKDKEGEDMPYWKEVEDGDIRFDFVPVAPDAVPVRATAEKFPVSAEVEESVADPAPAPATPKRAAQRQRVAAK